MVKIYLTPRRTYTAPDTSVTKITLEKCFTATTTTDPNQIDDMYLEEIEDEDFE
jgi:hypothetical protein